MLKAFQIFKNRCPNSFFFFRSVQIQLSIKFISQLDSTKFLYINLNLVGIEMGNSNGNRNGK